VNIDYIFRLFHVYLRHCFVWHEDSFSDCKYVVSRPKGDKEKEEREVLSLFYEAFLWGFFGRAISLVYISKVAAYVYCIHNVTSNRATL